MRSASGYACGLRLWRFRVILIPGKTVEEEKSREDRESGRKTPGK